MAIYDTMNYIPNDVATVGMGLAASMGQFLLCAGAKGKRYALPHARIMMHQPSGGMGGSASDIKIQAQQSLHIKKVLLRADRRAHRPAARAGRGRRRPRPLVHRPSRRKEYGFIDQVITSAREAADEGRPAPDSQGLRTDMNYYIPQWEERTSYGFRRIDPYAKLFEDRIIFLGTPISDDIANAVMAQLLCLESMDPDQRHPDLHQQPRWLVHRADRDLRHDAVHPARRADRVPGPGGLGGGGPARGRHAGQAAGAAQQPDPDPPALHRGHLRPDLRHRDPGQRDPADARAAREDDRRRTRGKTTEEVSRDIERDKILTAEQAVEYGLIDAILESRKATPVARPDQPDASGDPCPSPRRDRWECVERVPSESGAREPTRTESQTRRRHAGRIGG